MHIYDTLVCNSSIRDINWLTLQDFKTRWCRLFILQGSSLWLPNIDRQYLWNNYDSPFLRQWLDYNFVVGVSRYLTQLKRSWHLVLRYFGKKFIHKNYDGVLYSQSLSPDENHHHTEIYFAAHSKQNVSCWISWLIVRIVICFCIECTTLPPPPRISTVTKGWHQSVLQTIWPLSAFHD